MNQISFAVLILLNIMTLSQKSLASSDAKCSAIFHSSEFAYSNRSLETAPLPKTLVDRIFDEIPQSDQDVSSPNYIRVVESWGVLMNRRVSGLGFQAMKNWNPDEPHVIDIIVFSSMLRHLRDTESEHFKGDQSDIARLLSGRRLGHTLINKYPGYYRVGVHVRSEKDLSNLQGALTFGTIAPYGVAKQTVFSRNLLMPLPEPEIAELAKKRNVTDLDPEWFWLNRAQEGRVSYAAADVIAARNKSHLLRLNLLVMKSQLETLRAINPEMFGGDSLSLIRRALGRDIKVFSTSESEKEIRVELVIENPEQLEKLSHVVSFAPFHPYVVIPE